MRQQKFRGRDLRLERSEVRLVLRRRALQLLAEGERPVDVAQLLDVGVDTVCHWKWAQKKREARA